MNPRTRRLRRLRRKARREKALLREKLAVLRTLPTMQPTPMYNMRWLEVDL